MNIRYPIYEGVYRILTMENRVWKGLISRICAFLFPNYGRKSHDSGEISTFLWGEKSANPRWKCPANHKRTAT